MCRISCQWQRRKTSAHSWDEESAYSICAFLLKHCGAVNGQINPITSLRKKHVEGIRDNSFANRIHNTFLHLGNVFNIVEVDRRGCTFTVVGAELDDIIIKWYHISQMTVVSIYRKLFTTTPQSSIYIVDHWGETCSASSSYLYLMTTS